MIPQQLMAFGVIIGDRPPLSVVLQKIGFAGCAFECAPRELIAGQYLAGGECRAESSSNLFVHLIMVLKDPSRVNIADFPGAYFAADLADEARSQTFAQTLFQPVPAPLCPGGNRR